MSGNIFDQFDAPKPNPFDQFDSPASALRPGDIDPITKQPAQFMGAPSANVASAANPNEGAQPGPATQALASFAGNEEQRKRIFAAKMLPDTPIEEAVKRMFVLDGRLAMLGPDNKPTYLDPEPVTGVTTGPVRTWTGVSPGNVARNIAGVSGAVPATAGAIAGGLAASPISLFVGPALAAAGAAGGDIVRQYIARLWDPKDTGKSVYNPLPDDPMQTVREAAIGGAGQLGGAVLNRAMGATNPLHLRTQDVRRLQQPGAIDTARQAIETARAQGVDLSLGQATGAPGIIGMEDVIYRTPTVPGGQDVAGQFYQRQRAAVERAGQDMLARVSPETNKTAAALQFAEGAQAAVPEARRAGNLAARPAYEVAEGGGPARMGDLAARPTMAAAIQSAAAKHMDEFGAPAPAIPDFRMWDSVKKSLDDMISAAQRKGEYENARVASGLRQKLVARLDDIYPTYPEARALAAPGQRVSKALESTAAGRSATADIDQRAGAIVAPIFRESNPQYIKMARDAFIRSGNENAWDAGTRAYVQDVIDRTSRGMEGLNPAFLRRELIGNADNREALRAAMSPQRFAGFEKFMDMVTSVARTPAMNSATSPREVTARVLMEQAEPASAKVIRGIGAALSPDVLNTFRKIGASLAEGMTRRNAAQIVDKLFDRDGLRFLEAMAAVPVNQQQAANVKMQLLARALLSGRGVPVPGADPTASLMAPRLGQ